MSNRLLEVKKRKFYVENVIHFFFKKEKERKEKKYLIANFSKNVKNSDSYAASFN